MLHGEQGTFTEGRIILVVMDRVEKYLHGIGLDSFFLTDTAARQIVQCITRRPLQVLALGKRPHDVHYCLYAANRNDPHLAFVVTVRQTDNDS